MTHSESTQIEDTKPLKWLFGSIRFARGWIIVSVVAGLISGFLLIFQAALLSRIIHAAFIENSTRSNLSPLFIWIGILIILRAGLAWVKEISGFKAGACVREEIRKVLIDHIRVLGPIHPDKSHTGALSTAVFEQIESLQPFYAHYLPQLALAVSIPAAIVAFVFPVSWAAGGLLLLTAPLIPLFMILIGMGAESISQKHFQSLSRMGAHFLDILQGLSTLKLLGNSSQQRDTIAHVSDEYRLRTMKVLKVAFLSTAVLELFSSLAIALVAVYLGSTYLGFSQFGMYGQTLTLEHGLFILLLAPDFYLPLRELGIHYHARADAMGASQEIIAILIRKPAATWTGTTKLDKGNHPEIHYHNLFFKYPQQEGWLLKQINLELAPGSHIALVGESGSGKTTLLNLLLGFLEPDQGEICINGQSMKTIARQDWIARLSWIGQRPILFHDTIAANIAMANPKATDTKIEKAARSARVLDFAQYLPDGLETKVGEQGWGLSRGQAQRVALARVFLKDAPILLLDEPTAGLDMETATKLMEAIISFSKDRTMLMLTHRLHHIGKFNRIDRITAGEIVQNAGMNHG